MSNIATLFTGELQRMKKYNVLSASLVAAVIWIGVLHLADINDVTSLFPLLLFLDATSMSMLMVGVTMFFEKQEGSIKSLLVAPISKAEFIVAKTLANVVSNLLTLIALYAYAKIFREVNVNIVGLILAVTLIAIVHSLIGFILTYRSKDFTGMLMGMMKYAFVLTLPVIFEHVGMIKSKMFSNLLYLLPTKGSMTLLVASAGGVELWEVLLSGLYLLVAAGGIYYIVAKQFDQFAVRESGV